MKKKRLRATPTVTFQPETDVATVLATLSKGERSAQINEAVRLHHRQAALNLALREMELAAAKVRSLKGA